MKEDDLRSLGEHYQAVLHNQNYAEAADVLFQLAEALFHAGDSAHFLRLASLFPPAERIHHPHILITIGDAWRLQDNWHQANRAYIEAQQAAESHNNPITSGQALSRRGLVCWLRGDIEGSLEFFAQAQDRLAGTEPEHPIWDELDASFMLALCYVGRLDEAQAIAHLQIRTCQRRADAAGEWMALHNLGLMVYTRRGDFVAAYETLQEAFRLAQQTQNVFGVAYLANSLSYIAVLCGEIDSARTWSQQAYTLGEQLQAANVMAFSLLNQTHIAYLQGDFAAATAACAGGLAHIQSSFSSPLRCDLLLMQARIEYETTPAHALPLAHKALEMARLIGDQWMIGQCLLLVGEYTLHHADYAVAVIHVQEATAIFERYNDHYHLVNIHKMNAQLAYKTEDWQQCSLHLSAWIAALSKYPHLIDANQPDIGNLLGIIIERGYHPVMLREHIDNWGERIRPIAQTLLGHPCPTVRLWIIEILSHYLQPWAWNMLAHHTETVPAVQVAIQTGLNQAKTYPLPALQINSFGAFLVYQSDMPIEENRWTSLHAQIILVYLALNGSATRDQLIELLWPNDVIDKTGVRLRTTLKLLRQTLRPAWKPDAEYVYFQNDRYRLATSVSIMCDAQQFRYYIAQARRSSDSERYRLCLQAITVYRGDFFGGYFNDWVHQQREAFHTDYLWAHEECGVICFVERQYLDAEVHARTVINGDSLRERAWDLLIQALCAMKRDAEAAETQQLFHTHFHLELGLMRERFE